MLGAFSIFCPFAFKARSTTLIFVVCITFHQPSLLDDVHKTLNVVTGHKLCFCMFLSVPLIYWNTADLVLHWRCNYLPESNTCDSNIIRTHGVEDIVRILYVAARKLCLVVDSHVKILSCTLSYKNCHRTFLCIQRHFGTILTIFAKFRYCFDFGNLPIAIQPSRNKELCPFSILIEKYPVLQLLWCEKS